MINNQTTPEAAARGEVNEQVVEKWLLNASARQLEEFILCKKPYTHGNRPAAIEAAREYIERAKLALSIRMAEDAAKTADKLSQQTEKLVQQTEQLNRMTETHNRRSLPIFNQGCIICHRASR